jgi:hypothetical protein
MKDLIEIKSVSTMEINICVGLMNVRNKIIDISHIISPMFYVELWNDKHQTNPDREFLLSKN